MPRKDTGFRISPERILNFSLSPLTFISHHPDPVMGSLLSLSLSLFPNGMIVVSLVEKTRVESNRYTLRNLRNV